MGKDKYSDDHTIEIVGDTNTLTVDGNLSVSGGIDGILGDVISGGTLVSTKIASWSGSTSISTAVGGMISIGSGSSGANLSAKTILAVNIIIEAASDYWVPPNSGIILVPTISSPVPGESFPYEIRYNESSDSIKITAGSGGWPPTTPTAFDYRITVFYN